MGCKDPPPGGTKSHPLGHQVTPPGHQAAPEAAGGGPGRATGGLGARGRRWHRAARAAARLPPSQAVPHPRGGCELRAGLKQSQISSKFLPVEVGANPNQLMFAVPFEITAPGHGCAGSPSPAAAPGEPHRLRGRGVPKTGHQGSTPAGQGRTPIAGTGRDPRSRVGKGHEELGQSGTPTFGAGKGPW